MTEDESLKRYGTVAFGDGMLRRLIGFGRPMVADGQFIGFEKDESTRSLEVGVLINFVPDGMRPMVQEVVTDVAEKFIVEHPEAKVNETSLEMFIALLKPELIPRLNRFHRRM